MKTDWNIQEVGTAAEFEGNPILKGMLTQLASLLKSREDAKAVAWKCEKNRIASTVLNAEAARIRERDGWHVTPLFTHPPADSGEAKDAARYRYLMTCIDADFGPSLVWACDWSREYGSQLIVDSGQSEANFVSAIDAAMAAESREGKDHD